MAEKPKLKETDEILSSIGKTAKGTRAPRAAEPEIQPAPREAEEPLVSSALDAAGPAPKRRGRSAKAQAEPEVDANPLDFGKYQLPGRGEDGEAAPKPPARRRAAKKPPADPPEPAPAPEAQAVPEIEEAPAAPEPAPEKKSAPRRRSTAKKTPEPAPEPVEAPGVPEQPVVQEYTFEDFDAPQEPPAEAPKPKRTRSRSAPAAKTAEEEAAGQDAPKAPAKKPAAKKSPAKKTAAKSAASKTGEGAGSAAPKKKSTGGRKKKAEPEPEETVGETLLAPEPLAAPAEPQVPEREAYRENFLRRLSSQFEQEFSSRFEEKADEQLPAEEPSWFDVGGAAQVDPPLLPEEEQEADREAEEFLSKFKEKVKQEEQIQSETFKDTLAEKFARERERYLQELGIPDPDSEEQQPPAEEEPQPEPHARRRLDLQIQPEMHMQEGEAPPPRPPVQPMTYGPGGVARPQQMPEEEQDGFPYVPTRPAASHKEGMPTGKKTGEDLLFELAAQNSLRSVEYPQPRPQPVPRAPKKNLQLGMEEEPREKTPLEKKNRRRTIAISALAAVLILALIAWPVGVWLRLQQTVSDDMRALGEVNTSTETLTVYESRNYDTPMDFGDVLVKKAGISLRNINVGNHLVIGEIETAGEIQLEDITASAIYVRSCAVDSLVLNNVRASSLIINNSDSRVTVQVSGDSMVGSLEVKTPTTVRQTDLAADSAGVETVLVSKGDGLSNVDLVLDGVELHSLHAVGDTILTLSGGSVQNMTTEGNVSLSGEGRVLNLSGSSQELDGRMALQVKNVALSSLNLSSPADVNLSSQVDLMSVSETLNLSGNGVIGTMTLDNKFGVGRLPVDISGVTVNTLFVETEALVNVAGEGKVNTLTANQSVYALGNPVSYLVANAPEVIYENEPSLINIRPGVRPPESMADNPNLDYSLLAGGGSTAGIVDDDGVATTCNHTRESGGFVAGDGSASDPYQVGTPAQLAHVSQHLGSHFVQTRHIDISDDSQFSSGFQMIASGGTAFTGVYDGGGYNITNLRISSAGESVGLFAENAGTIRNVNIVSGEITATAPSRAYTGGIVGLNLQSGLVQACSNGARITGNSGGYAGGIVGYNFGAQVRDCYNYAKVSGVNNLGGVVGVNRDNARVVGSYNAGTIEGNLEVGAVAGVNTGATIVNCYYLADTHASGIGEGDGGVTEMTSDQLSAADMAVYLAAGDTDTPWTMPAAGNYTYPVLRVPESGQTSSGTASAANEAAAAADASAAASPSDTEPAYVDEV